MPARLLMMRWQNQRSTFNFQTKAFDLMSEPIYLVTGAHGFIGAWVVKKLLAAGLKTIIFDKSADPARLRLIMNDDEANRRLRRPYRAPWVHPEPDTV